MYQAQFIATSSAGWAQAIELIDSTTNRPLAIPDDATFDLEIGDHCWSGNFDASSSDGSITRPLPHILQWKFTPNDFRRYWSGRTHPVGLTMTTSAGPVQLLIGTLSIIDGVVR